VLPVSGYTSDNIDDAVLAGYSFSAVIDALNAGDLTEAGRALKAILDEAKADDVGAPTTEGLDALLPGWDASLSALAARLAVVPVR
jgi:hypothetical protein